MTWFWAGAGLLVLIVWVATLTDLFRRADLSTGAKLGWTAAIILFPVLATIVYVIARPKVVNYRSSGSPEAAEKAHEDAERIARERAAEQQGPTEERFNIR